MRRVPFRLSAVLFAFLLAVGVAACSSDDDGDSAEDTSTDDSTAASGDGDEQADAVDGICGDETLRILLTNDDGYGGEGFALLAETLAATPGVELTISAPLENQSGSSDSTTPGDPAELATEAITAGGVEGTAVDGFPADSVVVGLGEEGDASYDLVVSGINEGQNIGELEQLSGTVGAARTAARLGVPGFALSQGLVMDDAAEPDFQTGVDAGIEWIGGHCDEIFADPDGDAEAAILYSLNVPTCIEGEFQGVLELDEGGVPLDGRETSLGECAGGDPADEVDAFILGYAPAVPLPAD